MKTALFLFLSILALPCFSQSKKATNKILWEKHACLVRQNDSITGIITENNKKLMELGKDVYQTSRNLFDRRLNFKTLKKDIARVQKTLLELGFNPGALVRQEELDIIYNRFTEEDYGQELKASKSLLKPFAFTALEDLSQEKLKVQNERLAQNNQEYASVIDSNLQVIKNQQVQTLKANAIIQKMEAASTILIKDNGLLKEKYDVLRTKCSELELKKEEAELAAENARLEREEKEQEKRDRALSRSSGKKVKTIKFVPPVVIDEVEDVPSIRESDENIGYDIVPPPPPPVREDRTDKKEPVILEYVDEPASFPGGREALLKYLQEHIVYPQVAKDAGISGKVYLKFVVSDQGTISNVKVIRGIPDCPECDKEAIRVVKNMPKWIPGKNNGKAMNMYYNIPINFNFK